jgi:AraC-like DNA-binding protein
MVDLAPRLPLLNERLYVPYKIAALVEVLNEQGIPAEESLAGSEVDVENLTRPETRVSIRQYLTVCRNALRLSKDPATPFEVGKRIHLSAYGMFGFGLLCSVTIRDFFRLGVKYHKLATPLFSLGWREQDDEVVWVIPENFAFGQSSDLGQFLLEQQLTQLVNQLKEGAGRSDCNPTRASLPYAVPVHSALYKQYLDCECSFGMAAAELAYRRSILEMHPPMANRLTSVLLQEICDRLLGEVKTASSVSGEVYQLMMGTPGHAPTMSDVAKRLHLTVRTLHRHLEAEGTSFAVIAVDVRSSLATEYLRTTKLGVEDISVLLGFRDPANFRHAFRRWTGSTPSKFRPRS